MALVATAGALPIMNSSPVRRLLDGLPRQPAAALVRLAALAARPGGGIDAETRQLMRRQVAAGILAGAPQVALWTELEAGLMAPVPSRMLRALDDCGALQALLPEVAALFGVPQSADDPPVVDIGEHTLRVVDETARAGAPSALRFAALVMNVGKYDSPPEHLPSHYKHIERALPRIELICARFGVAPEGREMALLGLAECERVHRASRMRAGSIATLLARTDAFGRPVRFESLLTLCACDFRAYPGRAQQAYPKEALLRTALQACLAADRAEGGEAGRDERHTMAIARALRSLRWADDTTGHGA